MKKVLFVANTLNCGGSERSLVSLLNFLDSQKRYHIDLLLFQEGGILTSQVHDGIHILPQIKRPEFSKKGIMSGIKRYNLKFLLMCLKYRLGMKSTALHNMQFYWQCFSSFIGSIEVKYDVVIAYGQGIATYFAAEKTFADIKIAVVNTDYVKAGYIAALDRDKYEAFDKITVDSQQALSVFQQVFPDFQDKLELIHDIIDGDTLKGMARQADTQPFQEANGKLKILTVARLVESKGYDLAIQAARRLKESGVCFVWYALGDGPLKKKLQEDIAAYNLEDEFCLIGEVINPYPYFEACDILVHPSRFEGFGMVITEALIFDKLVVSTNFPAVYDQLADGETGLIVPMEGDAIFRALTKLIENQELARRIKTNVIKRKKTNIEEGLKFCHLIQGEK